MRFDKRLIALLFTLLFFGSACAVHMHDEGPRTRRGALRSAPSPAQCKQRCKSNFHSCKSHATGHKGKGKGKGASHCAHQNNSCEKRCG